MSDCWISNPQPGLKPLATDMAPLEFTNEEFHQIRQRAEREYKTIGQAYCSYFQGKVHFNTLGFRHIVFKSWRKYRAPHDQFMRLKHLPLAPEILSLSRTVQGIHETNEWERRHRRGEWEKSLISVTYYEFIAVLRGKRFKVIVKQLPGGERIFWSLIPFWRQTKEGKRLMHSGDPSTD